LQVEGNLKKKKKGCKPKLYSLWFAGIGVPHLEVYFSKFKFANKVTFTHHLLKKVLLLRQNCLSLRNCLSLNKTMILSLFFLMLIEWDGTLGLHMMHRKVRARGTAKINQLWTLLLILPNFYALTSTEN